MPKESSWKLPQGRPVQSLLWTTPKPQDRRGTEADPFFEKQKKIVLSSAAGSIRKISRITSHSAAYEALGTILTTLNPEEGHRSS